MLADFYCRGVLSERLDGFVRECAVNPPKDEYDFIVQDSLPFPFEYGDVVFDTERQFNTLAEYIIETQRRAGQYLKKLNLKGGDADDFLRDFEESMTELLAVSTLIMANEDVTFTHPIVKLASEAVIFKFYKNKGML